jgi:hypothetical protein
MRTIIDIVAHFCNKQTHGGAHLFLIDSSACIRSIGGTRGKTIDENRLVGLQTYPACVRKFSAGSRGFRPRCHHGSIPTLRGIGTTLEPCPGSQNKAQASSTPSDQAGFFHDPNIRKGRANRVGDIGRREVRIVPFRHPRIAVAQLRGDDAHGGALRCKSAGIGMAQDVKCRGRIELRNH